MQMAFIVLWDYIHFGCIVWVKYSILFIIVLLTQEPSLFRLGRWLTCSVLGVLDA